jgi:hypothetical protein
MAFDQMLTGRENLGYHVHSLRHDRVVEPSLGYEFNITRYCTLYYCLLFTRYCTIVPTWTRIITPVYIRRQ